MLRAVAVGNNDGELLSVAGLHLVAAEDRCDRCAAPSAMNQSRRRNHVVPRSSSKNADASPPIQPKSRSARRNRHAAPDRLPCPPNATGHVVKSSAEWWMCPAVQRGRQTVRATTTPTRAASCGSGRRVHSSEVFPSLRCAQELEAEQL